MMFKEIQKYYLLVYYKNSNKQYTEHTIRCTTRGLASRNRNTRTHRMRERALRPALASPHLRVLPPDGVACQGNGFPTARRPIGPPRVIDRRPVCTWGCSMHHVGVRILSACVGTVLEANEQWHLRAETYRLQGELLWFTDGFDTADRQEAKALLEELS
jgi:hypothetical protein